MRTFKTKLISAAFLCCCVFSAQAQPQNGLQQANAVGEAQKPSLDQVFSYKLAGGTYNFRVYERQGEGGYVRIFSRFDGGDSSKLGSIKEEAAALQELLAELKKRNLKVSSYCIPWVFQAEVIERVQSAAIKSEKWKSGKPEDANKILKELLKSSDAYKELREVLSAHDFKFDRYWLEKVGAEKKPGLKFRVPRWWQTYISMEM